MFCPNPFTRMEIKADGSVYCCCEGWLPKPLGNVLDENLLQIWNGPAAREIRSSILDESFRHCKACPYLPGPGGPVTREPRPSDPRHLLSESVGTLKLDYDQTCNLTCPSCRVKHSRDFVDVPKVQKIHDAVVGSGILARTKMLYVTGAGDPFASPLYWNFLCNLEQYELAPHLEIFLHTNGLLLDYDHWMKMKHATLSRVSEIGISVDAATAETYKFVRRASWSKLWNNVKFVNHLQQNPQHRTGKTIMLGMFYTVQAANFRELIPFVRLAWAHEVSWISVTALRNWGTFTKADYIQRAVHLPEHPDHEEFRRIISDPQLTCDPRIVMDKFNPEYVDQDVICNPEALLPENTLRKP